MLRVPRDYPAIQSAVDAAGVGDTIQLDGGVYQENVVVTTSGLRLHASGGLILGGSGLTGIGIHVRGSAAASVSSVEIENFVVQQFLAWMGGRDSGSISAVARSAEERSTSVSSIRRTKVPP